MATITTTIELLRTLEGNAATIFKHVLRGDVTAGTSDEEKVAIHDDEDEVASNGEADEKVASPDEDDDDDEEEGSEDKMQTKLATWLKENSNNCFTVASGVKLRNNVGKVRESDHTRRCSRQEIDILLRAHHDELGKVASVLELKQVGSAWAASSGGSTVKGMTSVHRRGARKGISEMRLWKCDETDDLRDAALVEHIHSYVKYVALSQLLPYMLQLSQKKMVDGYVVVAHRRIQSFTGCEVHIEHFTISDILGMLATATDDDLATFAGHQQVKTDIAAKTSQVQKWLKKELPRIKQEVLEDVVKLAHIMAKGILKVNSDVTMIKSEYTKWKRVG